MSISSQKQELNSSVSGQKRLGKVFSLEGKKIRYCRIYDSWDKIERAGQTKGLTDRTKYLSKVALIVLAIITEELLKSDRVILNHEQLSIVTRCRRKQNTRIIKELDNVLEIAYHTSIVYNDKKYLHSYQFRHKQSE